MSFVSWYRRVKLRRKLKTTIKMLKVLDILMSKTGYTRQQRRALWRTVAKSQENLIQYLSNMAGEGK
jgi:hypothetical protein